MKAPTARLYPVILMGMLAAATLWVERLVQPESTAADGPVRHIADFRAEGFTLTQINSSGQADTVLSASRGVHFADDGTTHLENPRLRQTRPAMPSVEITALRGTIDREGNIVDLTESVRAYRGSRPGEPSTTLETSALRIRLDVETANTDAPVHLTRGASTLEGTGMQFDNRSGQLTLDSRVRGSFVNTARQSAGAATGTSARPQAQVAP